MLRLQVLTCFLVLIANGCGSKKLEVEIKTAPVETPKPLVQEVIVPSTDLRPYGIRAVIDLPAGTTVSDATGKLVIQLPKHGKLTIVPSEQATESWKEEQKTNRVNKIHLDEPRVLIGELRSAAPKIRFGITVEVLLGDKRFLIENVEDEGVPSDLAVAKNLKSIAESLRQNDVILQGIEREQIAVEKLKTNQNINITVMEGKRIIVVRDGRDALLAEVPYIVGIDGVQAVEGKTVDADAMKHLMAIPGLRRLSVSTTVSDWTPIRQASHLREVDISAGKLTDADLSNFAALPHLRSLRIPADAGITGTSYAALEDLAELEVLSVAKNPITEESLSSIGKIQSLKLLDLGTTSITDRGVANLNSLSHLESLNLDGTAITDSGLSRLKLGALQKLNLSGTRISGTGLTQFQKRFPKMIDLNVSKTRFNDLGLETVQSSTLQKFDCSYTSITDVGIRHIAKLKSLTHLNVSCDAVTDAALPELAALTELKELALGKTAITGSKLASLQSLQQLTELALDDTPLDDIGLANLPILPKLNRLKLDNTFISDAGVKRLLEQPALKKIDLAMTRITKSGIDQIHNSKPNLKCEWTPKLEAKITEVQPPIAVANLKPVDATAFIKKFDLRPEIDVKATSNTIVGVNFAGKAISDADLSNLRDWKHLRKLDLSHCKNVTDAGLPYLALLPNLEELDLTGTDIKGNGLIHLQGLSKLRYLLLPDTELSPAQVAPLVQLKNLERIQLKIRDGDDECIQLFQKLPNLKSIGLTIQSANRPLHYLIGFGDLEELSLSGDFNNQGLIYLKDLPNLKKIVLKNSGLTDLALVHLKHCEQLERLQLINFQITDAGITYLKPLRKLIELELPGKELTDEAVSRLRDIESLAKLYLRDAPITDRAMTSFAEMKNLDTLAIPGSKITDAGLIALKTHEELRKLDFNNTAITGKGFASFQESKIISINLNNSSANDAGLAGIRLLPNLQMLQLNHTDVTDAGIEKLKKHPTLEVLQLADCPKITDGVIDTLKVMPSLTHIDLSGSAVTPKAIEALKQAKPALIFLGKE